MKDRRPRFLGRGKEEDGSRAGGQEGREDGGVCVWLSSLLSSPVVGLCVVKGPTLSFQAQEG